MRLKAAMAWQFEICLFKTTAPRRTGVNLQKENVFGETDIVLFYENYVYVIYAAHVHFIQWDFQFIEVILTNKGIELWGWKIDIIFGFHESLTDIKLLSLLWINHFNN